MGGVGRQASLALFRFDFEDRAAGPIDPAGAVNGVVLLQVGEALAAHQMLQRGVGGTAVIGLAGHERKYCSHRLSWSMVGPPRR